MLSRLPPASTLPHHPRCSTTGRLYGHRSRRRSRFLRFLKSQREKELRSRFLQSHHDQELRSDSTSGDWHSLSPQSLEATDVGSQLQHEDEESGSELDSPPRITMLPEPKLEKEPEPDFVTSPTSPLGSPCSVIVNPSVSGDWHSLLPQSLSATNVGAQSQHQGEQESGSELDCIMLPGPKTEESDSPTSPGSPCSVKVDPTRSTKDSPNDEDQHFNYLVDNFVSVAADVCSSALSGYETDYKVEIQRQSVLCAKSALEHYNNDEKNKIKYEFISATMCNDMFTREGFFSHVNFTAKSDQPNAKEELFFAELRWDHVTPEPTCVICLKGVKKIGGLRDTKYDNFYLEGLPFDKQNCYACNHQLKHPKNGELYNIGHIAMSQYYCFS